MTTPPKLISVCIAVTGCNHDGVDNDCAIPDEAAWTAALGDSWRLSVRYRDPDMPWEAPVDDREVRVPGTYYPAFGSGNREVELTYERELLVPDDWSCTHARGRHVLVEFDSVDYFADVELDHGGTTELLGSHQGYLGRFSVDFGTRASGLLRVKARDLRQASPGSVLEGPALVQRTTLQGMDPTAWGINLTGILEPVRLRLTGGLYLRNAFFAALTVGEPATVRLGAEIVPLASGRIAGGAIAWATPAANGRIPLTDQDVAQGVPLEVLEDIAVSGLTEATQVRIWLEPGDGSVSDSRTVPFLPRRVAVDGDRLLVNGQPTFMKGAGLYHASRFLAAEELNIPSIYAVEGFSLPDRYQDDWSFIAGQLDRLVEGLAATHATWVRPAHHVPARAFHEKLRDAGILVYQDFPLNWNTDFAALPEAEILRQASEFLWRAAAEPAIGAIAWHNEAEILDNGPDRALVHALLEKILARSHALAPHLVRIGCSGCAGKSTFWADATPLADDVVDKHAYISSVFLTHLGFREIPWAVDVMAQAERHPVVWSELAGGWPEHFDYLLGLDATITDTPLSRALEQFLVVGGLKLTMRQFYALVSCARYEGVKETELAACVAAGAVPENDRLHIQRAKDFFFADLFHTMRPGSDDPRLWRRKISAGWLAVQIYESRLRSLSGLGLDGTIPWDQTHDDGFPLVIAGLGDGLDETASATSAIIGAAYAPLAVYVRSAKPGEKLTLAILNDGPEVAGELVLATGGPAVWHEPVVVPAGEAVVRDLPPEVVAAITGTIAAVHLEVDGTSRTSYQFQVPETLP